MKSVTSKRIYLWSKILGAALLIAMAIVAAGNAQQFSAGEKGKLNLAGATIYPAGRRLRTIPPKSPRIFRQAVGFSPLLRVASETTPRCNAFFPES
jgi:hypothetical protein